VLLDKVVFADEFVGLVELAEVEALLGTVLLIVVVFVGLLAVTFSSLLIVELVVLVTGI
jgi:hypothetical protein